MPEVEHVGDWVQPESIRTREQHAVASGVNLNVVHDHGETLEHSGIIEYDHFLTTVFNPARDTAMAVDVSGTHASSVRNRRWRTTPFAEFFDPETYGALMHITGSALALHDYDPLYDGYFDTKTAEVTADFVAAHPSVHPDDVIVDFEGFGTWPIGTYSDRVLEVDLSRSGNVSRARDGTTITPHTDSLQHSVLLVPLTYGPGPTYILNEGGWTGVFGEDAFGHTWHDAADDFTPLTDDAGFGVGVNRLEIDDATWDANAGLMSNAESSYTSKGASAIIGPIAGIFGEDEDIMAGEQDNLFSTAAVVNFESDWLPPRYRVRWFTYTNALRHYPRDGDGLGWGGVVRHYPPPRGRRSYGGARQP